MSQRIGVGGISRKRAAGAYQSLTKARAETIIDGDTLGKAAIERVIQQARDFVEWCRATTSKDPWITETGWPTREAHLSDAARWNALGSALLSFCDAEKISTTYWTARKAVAWSGELVMAYGTSVGDTAGTLDTVYSQASIIEAHATNGAVRRGINMQTGLLGFNGGIGGTNPAGLSNTNIGAYGTVYTYGTAADYTFLKGRGIDTVRVGFRLERFFQAGPGGAINATEVARMTATLDAMSALGMKAVLSPLNYANYYLDVAGTPTGQILGSAGWTQAQFAAMWSALAGAFKDHAAVHAFELMGEPAACTTAVWKAASQAALTAIRGAGATTLVLVSGSQYQGVADWSSREGEGGWITDTGSNYAYSGHFYPLDNGGSFTGGTTFEQYAAAAEQTNLGAELGQGLQFWNMVETMPAHVATGSITAMVSGVPQAVSFVAPYSRVISRLDTYCGSQAGASLTVARIALATVDVSGNLVWVAETASDLTLWTATNAQSGAVLSTARGGPASYRLIKGQRYVIAALAVGASTMPRLIGAAAGLTSLMKQVQPWSAWLLSSGRSDLPAPGNSETNAGVANLAGRIYATAR